MAKITKRNLLDKVLELDSEALVNLLRNGGWSTTQLIVATGISGASFSKAAAGNLQMGEISWRKLARLAVDEGLIK